MELIKLMRMIINFANMTDLKGPFGSSVDYDAPHKPLGTDM